MSITRTSFGIVSLFYILAPTLQAHGPSADHAHSHHRSDLGRNAPAHKSASVDDLPNSRFYGEALVELARRLDNARILARIESAQFPDASEDAYLQLAWAIVAATRESQDESYYRYAFRVARDCETRHGGSFETDALKSHLLLQYHRFDDAKRIARRLVAKRGLPEDHGLLGDALLEQGRFEAAREHYEQFAASAYQYPAASRLAWLSWQTGDHDKAISYWRDSYRFASGAGANAAAWSSAHLGDVLLANGDRSLARRYYKAAIAHNPKEARARYGLGLIRLHDGDPNGAVSNFSDSIEEQPLPDRLWNLEDALREIGDTEKADAVRARIIDLGDAMDPRSTALYLAFHDISHTRALNLAQHELAIRQDPLTWTTLAFCYAKAGDMASAERSLKQVADAKTLDPRVSLYAAYVANALGDREGAAEALSKIGQRRLLLTKSENEELRELIDATTASGLADRSLASATTKK